MAAGGAVFGALGISTCLDAPFTAGASVDLAAPPFTAGASSDAPTGWAMSS